MHDISPETEHGVHDGLEAEELDSIPTPVEAETEAIISDNKEDLGAHPEHHPGLSDYLRDNKGKIVVAGMASVAIGAFGAYLKLRHRQGPTHNQD